jgi:hypothetical protein
LIEKAQMRAARPQGPAAAAPPASTPAPASLLPETQGEAVQERDAAERPVVHQPMYFFFDSDDWKSRADRALARTRQAMMEHRRRQISLCDASRCRIESSRSLLRDSVPVRPGWLDAAK